LATSFVAGFQSKATADVFSSSATPRGPGEIEPQKVPVTNHRHYWKHATMPVFITAIDGNGMVLVEDAGAYLHLKPDATEIEVVRPLETVISDIRLRMFTHALAPWISPGLRQLRLGSLAPFRSISGSTVWDLLANQFAEPQISYPLSWTDITQYFHLLSYLIDDQESKNELRTSLATPIDRNFPPMGLFLLGHMIDMALLRAEFIDTALQIPSVDARSDVEGAAAIIRRVWAEAADCLSCDAATLVENLKEWQGEKFEGFSSDTGQVLLRVAQGEDVGDVVLDRSTCWGIVH
jgi:hypothetical protein